MYMREKNISEDRKKYLRKVRKGKISVIITQLLILVIFLIGWEILANQGIIDSFITSQPSRILATFLNLSSNRISTALRRHTNRNFNRFHIRCHFRNSNSHLSVVVTFFVKSIRTLFSCIKQLTQSSPSDLSLSYG